MDATLYLSPFRSNVGAMLGSGSGSSSNGSVPALEEAKRRRQEAEAALFAADSKYAEAVRCLCCCDIDYLIGTPGVLGSKGMITQLNESLVVDMITQKMGG